MLSHHPDRKLAEAQEQNKCLREAIEAMLLDWGAVNDFEGIRGITVDKIEAVGYSIDDYDQQ